MVQHQLARFDPATGRFSKDSLSPLPPGFFELDARSGLGKRLAGNRLPKWLMRKSDGAEFVLQDATLIYGVLETSSEIWVAAFEGLYKITPRKRLFETPFLGRLI